MVYWLSFVAAMDKTLHDTRPADARIAWHGRRRHPALRFKECHGYA